MRRPPIERLDRYRWRIPATGGMRVPGLIYAKAAMIDQIHADKSSEQVAAVAHLPGIVGRSIAMPDIHQGYGFPIGGVAAFDADQGGVISPGGVGYDINCGVRLLSSRLSRAEIAPRIDRLADALFEAVPAGLGRHGRRKLTDKELNKVMVEGAAWALRHGQAREADLEAIEERGKMPGADPAAVSERARERGRDQLGSLGSGNHFCEVGCVDQIYDPVAARAMGLAPDTVTLMVHSGSRGFGHQICDESLRVMLRAAAKYRIELPDRQLCAAPLGSPEARRYRAAMACAVNFAFANRQLITAQARGAFTRLFGGEGAAGLDLVYDVCHNIAKDEIHSVDGTRRTLCVHRKGATRAFGPGHPALPARYSQLGQPVIIPGDMGRCSYVLVGAEGAMEQTFGSSCHGAGRRLSRTKARQAAKGRSILRELAERGVTVRSTSKRGIAEELPEAYKDVGDVVDVVAGAGIARKVARLVPLAVIKG